MTLTDIDPVAEVRATREKLLAQYGGVEGLHSHMDTERPELERQGWVFVAIEDLPAQKHAQPRVTA